MPRISERSRVIAENSQNRKPLYFLKEVPVAEQKIESEEEKQRKRQRIQEFLGRNYQREKKKRERE